MALFDAFLKLDGIKGESADAKHKGEIDIYSFSWGVSQTGIQATGGGGGAGKVSFQDISFVKKADASSPLLMLNCANGAHIKEGNFVVRKAGGTQLEYLKIKLTDILISGFKDHGSISGGDIPTESLTLNFAKVEYSYQPQGADGKAQGGPILAGWDVKANQKV
ncbi:MAG: type VI secretion system tube protein Hcp [Candidatus Solibacter sp.]|jgi:type VI secretion system secreted protein Hcp